jgi:hypothetical protein
VTCLSAPRHDAVIPCNCAGSHLRAGLSWTQVVGQQAPTTSFPCESMVSYYGVICISGDVVR